MTEYSPKDGPEQQDIQERPLVEVLVDNALERHNSQRSFVGHFNQTMPYSCLIAAEDAVKNSGKGANELFESLVSQTTVGPRDLLGDAGLTILNTEIAMGFIKDWDDFKNKVSSMIIQKELERRHPEVIIEDRKRDREFGLRSRLGLDRGTGKLFVPPKLVRRQIST